MGNAPGAALLEVTLGGLRFARPRAATLALTGAPCGGDLDRGTAVTARAGSELRLTPPATGLRSYLAVRGGIDVESVLGSRSTDLLSGLGRSPLRAGDTLPIGRAVAGEVSEVSAPGPSPANVLSIDAGPRDDWFAGVALDQLTGTEWTVRGESDRIGIRLDGPALERSRVGELPSEAMLPGALQVPPDGRPILFSPDCPVTGGYPVIAVVRTPSLDVAAQLRPGDAVRFTISR
ncbi:MAG: biotin-dependent carboxyltransferase family protein [Actinomycetota bacterium]|nr:biotin-dependent carboxyltransferase family protein [Actinomycetota bacterium]